MFLWDEEVPPNVGFPRFGVYHLFWLGLTVLLCALPLPEGRARSARIMRVFTSCMGASELLRLAILAYSGHFSVSVLPLHLCGMAVWFCLLHAWSGWNWLGQILYILCLPGAAAALLFPDWVAYPPYNYFCIHSFAIHAATVCYIVRQTRRRVIIPRFCGVAQAVAFLCVLVPPMLAFDRIFGTNFLFLCAAPPGSPLVLLWNRLGPKGYLVGYAAAIFLLMTGMVLFYRKISPLQRKKRAENS